MAEDLVQALGADRRFGREASADVVVSMGCDLKGQPKPRGTLQSWDDVPGPGENLAGADEAIRRHVRELVDELWAPERLSAAGIGPSQAAFCEAVAPVCPAAEPVAA